MRIALKDFLPGTHYALQVRATDGEDYSEWSTKYILETTSDTIAPKTPANVNWVVNGTSFRATWDAVTENEDESECRDLKHYEILINGIHVYTTVDTTFEYTFEMNLSDGLDASVEFQVAARDLSGNISSFSTVILATNPPPAEPANFNAQTEADSISLKWDAVNEDDLKEYRAYLSTTDPGFTPGPSNLVWSGLATNFTHYSSLYGTDHYFKLAAIDAFNTPSTYAADDAQPGSSTGIDTDPPAVVTGLAANASLSESGLVEVLVTWNAVTDSDLAGYTIRYRPSDLSEGWSFINVGYDVTETLIKNLDLDEEYEFQAQSFDFTGNRSVFTASVLEELTNAAPSKPSAPTVVSDVQGFAISHDLTKDAGGDLEADVVELEVWVGVSTPTDKLTSVQVNAGSPVVVSEHLTYVTDDVTLNVYVRAVDAGGLTSPYSDPDIWTVGKIQGTYIEDATITNAKIQSVEANKITAGSGIINDLLIKSKLTVDAAGTLESSNFDATNGYQLSDSSLIIRDGTISARTIDLQLGGNLMSSQYANFEFFGSYYEDGDVTLAPGNRKLSWNTQPTALEVTDENFRFGDQSLKLQPNLATDFVWLAVDPFGATHSRTNMSTLEVDPSVDYIISFYVYNDSLSAADITLDVVLGNTSNTQVFSAPSQTWIRLSRVINSGAETDMSIGFAGEAGTTYFIDGIQVEPKTSTSTEPSLWYPPSHTVIDGGSIRTGQIRSYTTINVNGVDYPEWSINSQGGAQFGSASVRGSLIIGSPDGLDQDDGESIVRSSNYVPNVAGWIIKSDGEAEFNNITARGDITSTSLRVENPSSPILEYLEINTNTTTDDPQLIAYNFGAPYLWIHPRLSNGGWVDIMSGSGDNDYHTLFRTTTLTSAIELGTMGELTHPDTKPLRDGFRVASSSQWRGQLQTYFWNGSASETGGTINMQPYGGNVVIGETSADYVEIIGDLTVGGNVQMANLRHQYVNANADVNVTTSSPNWSEPDTGCRVSLTAPPSGMITILLGATIRSNTANTTAIFSVEVRQGGTSYTSGGTVIHPPSDQDLRHSTYVVGPISNETYTLMVSGLTPGQIIRLRGMCQVQSGATATYYQRNITVIPSP